MPLPLAAKGLIIVSGIVVAASIALYENEQFREWVQTTGRKVTDAWDEFVYPEQRQRQRRRQPMAHGPGPNASGAGSELREMGIRPGNREPSGSAARRTLYENASQSGQQASLNDDGLRKRRARDAEVEEDREPLVEGLGAIDAVTETETEEKNESIFNQPAPSLLEQADSVLDLPSEALESTAAWKTASPSLHQDDSVTAQTQTTDEKTSRQLASETGLSLQQPSLLDEDTDEIASHNLSRPETAETIDISNISEAQTPDRSISPSHALASSHLTINIPTALVPGSNTAFLTPTTAPHSPSFISTPGSVSPVEILTPPFDADDYDALSDVGTETASHVSMRSGRNGGVDSDENDDMQSVTSETSAMSGWSEVERQ